MVRRILNGLFGLTDLGVLNGDKKMKSEMLEKPNISVTCSKVPGLRDIFSRHPWDGTFNRPRW
jgi:hypothetical protein